MQKIGAGEDGHSLPLPHPSFLKSSDSMNSLKF